LDFAGGEVRVDLRPVGSLLPHEEVIPEQLQKIASQITRDGVQKDPLIVDRESGTVLDGMHRLAALVQLRYENVVCCLVDYGSQGIELRRWARVYTTTRKGLFSEALQSLGVNVKVSISQAFDLLEARKSGLAVFGEGASLVKEGKSGLEDAFSTAKSLDDVAHTLGWKRDFVREDEVDLALQDPDNFVLLFQRLGKQDVLNAARTGRLFPCKTSLHSIDPRPVALDFPLKELNGASSRSLSQLLEKRSPKFLPPNSEYAGRRYKERLLVLNPK
jgi:hypothetical protein